MYKRCVKCGLTKEINDFYKHARYTGGYRSECKECSKKRVTVPVVVDKKPNLYKEFVLKNKESLLKDGYKTDKYGNVY